jgi:hypothetical protein
MTDEIELLWALLQFFGGGLCILMFATLVIRSSWRNGKLRGRIRTGSGLGEIAERLAGSVERSNPPFVRFRHGNVDCFFLQWAIGSGEVSGSTLEVCHPAEGFLEISSEHSRRALTRFPRSTELPPRNGFRIVTTDRAWAERTLEGGLAELLRRLSVWTPKPLRIRLSPGRLTLDLEDLLGAEDVVHWIGYLDPLLKLVGPPSSEGIRILSARFDPARGRCPVCSLAMLSPIVLCAACSVPHHQDCWSYLGRCGIFGCTGRR